MILLTMYYTDLQVCEEGEVPYEFVVHIVLAAIAKCGSVEGVLANMFALYAQEAPQLGGVGAGSIELRAGEAPFPPKSP